MIVKEQYGAHWKKKASALKQFPWSRIVESLSRSLTWLG